MNSKKDKRRFLKEVANKTRSLSELDYGKHSVFLLDTDTPGGYIDHKGKRYTAEDIRTTFPGKQIIALPDNGRQQRRDHSPVKSIR